MGLKKPLLFYEKLEVIGLYTILICDDDRDIVSALDIYLTSEGYRTLKAYDGLECLRLVERIQAYDQPGYRRYLQGWHPACDHSGLWRRHFHCGGI